MRTNCLRIIPSTLKIAALCVALTVSMLVNAQVNIDWQQCYGSLGLDRGYSIVATSSGFTVLGEVVGDPVSGMYECHNYFPSYQGNWMIGIDNAGDYIVTFTLPNGDVYYGEFTVTN